MMVTGAQTAIFHSRGGFLEQRHFNKHFIFDTRMKDRAGKSILHILKLFLLLEEFQSQYSLKIVLVKKILTWTNSFYVQTRTASEKCCTKT